MSAILDSVLDATRRASCAKHDYRNTDREVLLFRLRERWVNRAKQMGWNPGTIVYAEMQLEWFQGAHNALECAGVRALGDLLVVLSTGICVTEII